MHTFSYCEAMFCTKCDSQIRNEYHFCSTCALKTRSELTDSLQLKDSICEKDIIWNYFQAGYRYEVIVMFHRLCHNINISKRTSERTLVIMVFEEGDFQSTN